MVSYRLPKDTGRKPPPPTGREAAMLNAARVPLETARMAVEVCGCAQAVTTGNRAIATAPAANGRAA
jgi:hypothetical protein